MMLLKTMVGRVLVMVKTHTVDSCAVLFYLAAVISNKSSLLCECLASSEVEAQKPCPLPGSVLIEHMSKTLDRSGFLAYPLREQKCCLYSGTSVVGFLF